MKRYFILIILSLGLLNHLTGNKIVIHNLNEKYDLTKNRVNCMFQDSKGFLWFGMVNGLYKFDQSSFTFYSSKGSKDHGFPEADISSIIEIEQGLLLIGTNNKGLMVYNIKANKYAQVNTDSSVDFSKLNVKCLHKDKTGDIWVGTYRGLFKIRYSGDQSNRFKVLDSFEKESFGQIFRIKESDDGKIWFTTMTIIRSYDPKTKKIRVYSLYPESVSSIFFLDQKRILIGCLGSGLKILNLETSKFENIRIPGLPEKSFVKYVYKDRNSNIWLSISNEGLALLGPKIENSSLTLISNKNQSYNELNSNVIYQISESNDGALWICSEEGINMIDIKQNNFKSYSCHPAEQNIGIRSLLDSKRGFIWAGTIGGGLKQFHLNTNQYTEVSLVNQGYVVGKNIQAIIQDHQGDLWLGTEGDGVIRFHPDKNSAYQKGTTINYRVYTRTFPARTMLNDFVMCLLQDRHKNIWIGTWYGLSIIDSADVVKADQSKINIKNYLNNTADSMSISNNTIMSLIEDNKGDVWVGTQGGLNKAIKTPQGYKFSHSFTNINGDHLTEKMILTMYQSKNGNLWFSTQDGGIALLNKSTGIYREFRQENGFCDYVINSISEDFSGKLWLGSNNGLLRFDQQNHSFTNYTTEDGIMSNDFLFASTCKVGNQLYFGVNGGLTFFDPKEVVPLSFKPNLVFTDFRLFNKPVPVNNDKSPLGKHISFEKSVVLKYNQNFITISFAALNYKYHKGIRYSCIMEGLENSWNNLGREGRATYTNLAPGEYIFKVKAYSISNYANSSVISLKIIIKPPFWKTYWAYLIYLLLISFALIQTYVYFITREKRKNAIELERLKAKKVHELDLMRLQFFTNISHEFRTPLTLLSAPLETLINENPEPNLVKSYYQLMLKNVKRLTRLIDQLLDLRKIEEGYLKMEWAQGDIIDFVRKIYSTFQNYAEKRNMYFTFHSDIQELNTFFDSDKLDKILFNLLSNAFKYTEDYGTISIKLNEKNSTELAMEGINGRYLEIKVSDSGAGIPKDSLSELFKPFHQINHNKPIGSGGTGIGLSLTKELVELHKGFITVDSEMNVGSLFTIYLPIYTNHPENKENISEGSYSEKTIRPQHENINEEQGENGEATQASAKPLVLIVEDNSDLRTFLRTELEKQYRILEASNGQEGLDEAVQKVPDLVISDIMMEKMDGVELCHQLKTDERTSHIPVILLTARHSEDIKLSSFETGADDYITKPFHTVLLISRIKNLIDQRRKLRILFGKENNFDPQFVTTNKIDSKFLEKLNQIIEKNIDNPKFDPSMLASDMCLSKMQLYRKIAALTNQTVFNYIRTIRLNKAAQLLLTTEMQVSQIAMSVGYPEPSNFTRCFIKQFSQTPSQYVRNNRK